MPLFGSAYKVSAPDLSRDSLPETVENAERPLIVEIYDAAQEDDPFGAAWDRVHQQYQAQFDFYRISTDQVRDFATTILEERSGDQKQTLNFNPPSAMLFKEGKLLTTVSPRAAYGNSSGVLAGLTTQAEQFLIHMGVVEGK